MKTLLPQVVATCAMVAFGGHGIASGRLAVAAQTTPASFLRPSTGAELAPAQEARNPEPLTEPGPTTAQTAPPDAVSEFRALALYALSRGRGVPAGARETLTRFRDYLRAPENAADVVQFSEQRVGLEGETKICAEFTSPTAAERAWCAVQRMAKDQDLIDIRAERCEAN